MQSCRQIDANLCKSPLIIMNHSQSSMNKCNSMRVLWITMNYCEWLEIKCIIHLTSSMHFNQMMQMTILWLYLQFMGRLYEHRNYFHRSQVTRKWYVKSVRISICRKQPWSSHSCLCRQQQEVKLTAKYSLFDWWVRFWK